VFSILIVREAIGFSGNPLLTLGQKSRSHGVVSSVERVPESSYTRNLPQYLPTIRVDIPGGISRKISFRFFVFLFFEHTHTQLQVRNNSAADPNTSVSAFIYD
jgi:hypothetical protein